MADEKRAPHSLKTQTADQIRNEQRGGGAAAVDPAREVGPEANATMRKLWSEPGGEAHSLRNATIAAGTKADGHGDLTAAETPEATKRLSDATLSPEDRDATGEAIARTGDRREATSPTAEADEAASHLGQEDAGGKAGSASGSVKKSGL